MTTVSDFHRWYDDRRATFELESQIMVDKLAQGIDGIEWLVMQVVVTDLKQESMEQWLRFLQMFKINNIDEVMRNALIMDEHKFYEKYEFNWWISIDETLTYLSLLKQKNYDRYFEFIKSLQ